MANVYCDMSLGTGSNDGTSWANAYQSLATALNGSNVTGGDVLYVKGTESIASSQTLNCAGGGISNPCIVLGCKSGTTNEPPTTSDLIPGWRTGQSRTEANLAYNDGDIPTLTVTGAGNDISFQEFGYFYGIKFVSPDDIVLASSENAYEFEECHINAADRISMVSNSGNNSGFIRFRNCNLEIDGTFNGGAGHREYYGGKITGSMSVFLWGLNTWGGEHFFYGTDLSAAAYSLVRVQDGENITARFMNCQFHSSTALTTGTAGTAYRVEAHHCSTTTGKSSGTNLEIDIETEAGSIVEETTAIRTGGANDGSSSYSLAFTPAVNGTRDQYYGLVGPWMAFKVSGDGTSKTVTVYIANSGAGDYNDDDVWLEVIYPSEGGTAQYDNQTTQMDLLGTPSAVTDDTTSTWGTGGNNPQKLQATIAPDYVGRAYCRVVFAKNFSSSPETLYVDPLPEVS